MLNDTGLHAIKLFLIQIPIFIQVFDLKLLLSRYFFANIRNAEATFFIFPGCPNSSTISGLTNTFLKFSMPGSSSITLSIDNKQPNAFSDLRGGQGPRRWRHAWSQTYLLPRQDISALFNIFGFLTQYGISVHHYRINHSAKLNFIGEIII